MDPVLLLPAGAAVLALVALTAATARLATEARLLRAALRRANATGVAAAELSRVSNRVRHRMETTQGRARHLRHGVSSPRVDR